MDYTIYYKSSCKTIEEGKFPTYDLFISGFDHCQRTKEIFSEIKAMEKLWLIFPHYKDINEPDYNNQNFYVNSSYDEDVYFENFLQTYNIEPASKLCIDITGFIRPHLVYFIKLLYISGIKKIDFVYSEPLHYKNAENTNFTRDLSNNVSEVKWCSAEYNNPDTQNDILIITPGYDDQLVQKVRQEYVRVKNTFYIIGFPSLQLDMYQESILKLHKIVGNKEDDLTTRFDYAPAVDPFVTAQIIHDIIEKKGNTTNIYLCPISTKPQTLGIVLYYLTHYKEKPISIIFPYSNDYNINTAIGKKRVWRYTFELP